MNIAERPPTTENINKTNKDKEVINIIPVKFDRGLFLPTIENRSDNKNEIKTFQDQNGRVFRSTLNDLDFINQENMKNVVSNENR